MKKFFFIALLFFAFTFTASANDNNDPKPRTKKSTYNPSSIFFQNTSNDLLFVDLETIQETIVTINITKNDAVVMEEDVAELPQNTIHEVELTLFEKGEYSIELVTIDNIVITKEITVE